MSESSGHPRWQAWQMDSLDGHGVPVQDPQAGQRELLRHKAFQHKLELQAQREKVFDEARQAGHAQGMEQGHAQGLAAGREEAAMELQVQLQAALQPLRDLCRNFEDALGQLDAHIATQLTRVALDMARQLAGEALTAQPEQVIVQVRNMLASHPELTGKPRLWLHPDDLQRVHDSLAEELEAAGWRLHADPSILPGGCRVVSASGELDATRQARWQTLDESAGQVLDQALAVLAHQQAQP